MTEPCDDYKNAPDHNKDCVFPFQYQGKEYVKCTSADTCKGCFWCGTQYNVTSDAGWGVCAKTCPKQGGMNIFIRFYT